MTSCICYENITVQLEGRKEPLFQNLSMKFLEGKLHGLQGANGSGKTTLLHALQGHKIPGMHFSGFLSLDEKQIDLEDLRRSHQIQLIPQRFDWMISDSFSFLENLDFAKIPRHPSFSKRLKGFGTLPSLIEKLQINTDCPARLLSGGQRQLLALLMSLQRVPRLLLLDEPTATLDPMNARWVFKHLLELIEETKTTAVVVCHDFSLMKEYVNGSHYKLIINEDGKRDLTEVRKELFLLE